MRDLVESIETTVHQFRSEFGNLEHTVEVDIWEDESYQVEVYHTAGRLGKRARPTVCRRLSVLRDVDGSLESREYMWRPDSVIDSMDQVSP